MDAPLRPTVLDSLGPPSEKGTTRTSTLTSGGDVDVGPFHLRRGRLGRLFLCRVVRRRRSTLGRTS